MGDPIDLDHIERLLAEATPGPLVMCGDPRGVALIAALVTAAPAMVAEIRRLRAEVATAREEGRAEERAAIVAWLLDEGVAFLSEDIERGKHREEGDNA